MRKEREEKREEENNQLRVLQSGESPVHTPALEYENIHLKKGDQVHGWAIHTHKPSMLGVVDGLL